MHVCCFLGDEEVDDTWLRDDAIFQLKQQMATQQQRIADLEHRNKKLEEISIKKEGVSIAPIIASACLLGIIL